MTQKPPTPPHKAHKHEKPQSNAKKERLAKALRENLLRRKGGVAGRKG